MVQGQVTPEPPPQQQQQQQQQVQQQQQQQSPVGQQVYDANGQPVLGKSYQVRGSGLFSSFRSVNPFAPLASVSESVASVSVGFEPAGDDEDFDLHMDFDGALSSQLDSVTLGNTFKVSASNPFPRPPRHISKKSSEATTSCQWEDPGPSPLLAPRWTLWDRAGDMYARCRTRRSSPHSQRHNTCQFSFAGGIIFCLILQLIQSSSGFQVLPATASLVGSLFTAALPLPTTVPGTNVRIIDRVTTGHVRMMAAPLCLGRTSHVEQAIREIACVDSGCFRGMTPSCAVL